MAWLRIDDTAPINRKRGQLTGQEKASLEAVWAYCARTKNGGIFTLDDLEYCAHVTAGKLQKTTPRELKTFVEAGLVDAHEDGITFSVHDWNEYQPKDPTAAERKQRSRLRAREQTENNAPKP